MSPEPDTAATADPLLERVRAIVLDILRPYGGTAYLFGSWASGTRHRTSDIDVAIETPKPLPGGVLARLREALEESSVPYRVDVVDLADADPDFRERVRREGTRWTVSASA
jgi:hypothetical protein